MVLVQCLSLLPTHLRAVQPFHSSGLSHAVPPGVGVTSAVGSRAADGGEVSRGGWPAARPPPPGPAMFGTGADRDGG